MSLAKNIYLRVIPIVLLSTLSVLAMSALLKNSSSSRPEPSNSSAADDPVEPLQNIRFTVYDVGIYPPVMQVNAGRVAIAFDDRTRSNRDFVVQRINGNSQERVGQEEPLPGHARTRFRARLTPGSYRIFSNDRPEIYSTLIVDR